MGYDDHLAGRIREYLCDEPGVVEKSMFGGLAFLVGGHMAVAANSRGALLARVDPDEATDLLTRPGVEPMDMGTRRMRGWLHVEADAIAKDADLAEWIDRGLRIVHDLSPKTRPRGSDLDD